MIRIEYEDLPYGANEEVIYSSTRAQSISSLDVVNNNSYATLELNSWRLNGTKLIPSTNMDNFFWSSYLSDENGEYAVNPTITVQLENAITSTGMTFYFDNELYTFEIHYRLENMAVLDVVHTATSFEFIATDYVDGWDNAVIEFTRSLTPNRFVKLKNIIIGQFITFTGDELTNATAVAECSPISDELPIGTFDFSLKDLHNRIFNFQNRQRMIVYQNEKLVGVYFVENAKRNSRIDYDISCVDAIGILDNSTYYGGIYNNVDAETLITTIVGNDAEVELHTYDADGNITGDIFEGLKITGYLPICTKRDALNQIAMALSMTISTYQNEKIVFKTLALNQQSVINEDRIFSEGASVETSSRISEVDVTYHTYILSGTQEQAYTGTINGINTITFNKPYGNYSITGGTILTSGANFVTVNGTGEVTINAYEYVDNKVIATKLNPRTSVQDKNNVIEITDATLVNANNVNTVLNNIYNYSLYLSTISQTIVVDNETPAKMVSSVNVYGNRVIGYITKMNLRFTRNTYAEIELVGNEVDKSTAIAPRTKTVYTGEEIWV